MKVKLNPVRSILQNKRVVLIDDSIVRGNTSQKIVKMVRSAGATEVHFRISCPPTIGPCYYGVDTPTEEELIASHKTVPEIADFIGVDSLQYLSLDGLHYATEDAEKKGVLHRLLHRQISGAGAERGIRTASVVPAPGKAG